MVNVVQDYCVGNILFLNPQPFVYGQSVVSVAPHTTWLKLGATCPRSCGTYVGRCVAAISCPSAICVGPKDI